MEITVTGVLVSAAVVVLVAVAVYFLTQLVDREVRFESTVNADQYTVANFLLDIKNYDQLNTNMKSVTSTSPETTKDGVTTSTVDFVERPAGSPVDLPYTATRKVWLDQGTQYIQYASTISGYTRLLFAGLATFDLTTMVSMVDAKTTKVEQVAKLKLPRISQLVTVPAFLTAEKVMSKNLKKLLEQKQQESGLISYTKRVYAWVASVYKYIISLYALVKSVSYDVSGLLKLINKKTV